MKVRIVQLLCPSRHCIVATAYESEDGQPIPEMAERVRTWFDEMVAKGANPWCGICQSRTLIPEDNETIYGTMAEAMPFLQEASDRQAFTREYLRASRS